MLLHTPSGLEYDTTRPNRVSLTLRYAGDNSNNIRLWLNYKPKNPKNSWVSNFKYPINISHGGASFLFVDQVALAKDSSKLLSEVTSNKYLAKFNMSRTLRPFLSSMQKPFNRSLRLTSKQLERFRYVLLRPSIDYLEKYREREPLKSSLAIMGKKSKTLPLNVIQNGLEKSYSLAMGSIISAIDKHRILGVIRSQELLEKSLGSSLENQNTIQIDRSKSYIIRGSILYYLGLGNSLSLYREGRNKINLNNSKSINSHEKTIIISSKILLQFGILSKLYRFKESRFMERIKTQYISKTSTTPRSLTSWGKLIFSSPSIINLRINNNSMMRIQNTKSVSRGISDLFRDFYVKRSLRKLTLNIEKISYKMIKKISGFPLVKPLRKFLKSQQLRPLVKFRGLITHRETVNNLGNPNLLRPLKANIKIPLYKAIELLLDKLSIISIDHKKDKSLVKREIPKIYLASKRYGIDKLTIPQINNDYISKRLEVIKRWWVVSPGSELDEKILPPDYDYKSYPLLGSPITRYKRMVFSDNIDSEQYIEDSKRNLRDQYFHTYQKTIPYEYEPIIYTEHPNSPSMNPYIEQDDRGRGLYEMPLAINIMIGMVNIIGMILHHQASQLCYCTGQEAMWFIMEMLDKWLNLETTQKQLNTIGAREHYYRAYRWIRWEAEKVYFNCEASNNFQGLKAAGQLLANLIEYMKFHHFNIVPIAKDLGKLDYWKSHSPTPRALKLDKMKGRRHLNINTQRLDKKSLEGIPKK